MTQKITKFKLPSLKLTETQFKGMPFGRQIEYIRKIEEWKKSAKSTHLSQKRTSYLKAIRDFCRLNDVAEYFCEFHNEPTYWDDSFEFWYTTKMTPAN